MFDNVLRKSFADLSEPLADLLTKIKIKPNQITCLGFLLALGAALLIALNYLILGLVVWVLSRLADGLDGVLARRSGRVTKFGGYLDIVSDMASYSVMIIGFSYALPACDFYWKVILLLYTLVITSVLALGGIINQKPPEENRSLDLRPGLAEATETSIVYFLLCILPSCASMICPIWIAILFTTVIQRGIDAYRLLRD
ncbi:MAG: CDP-alcohol phosphatidyltransferase family protein [Candidatus Caenarcaniphilales bacterium]|nr:CDP-alcohol phosphatidyltransferase family protein [Candidatus Caenarcaniphilales bacterium]